MKQLSKFIMIICSVFFTSFGYGQVDSAKKFEPQENSSADRKLKKEIEQKQLLDKPVVLNTAAQENLGKTVLKKKKISKKVCVKKRSKSAK